MHLSVIIPAYNEEKIIYNSIINFNNYLKNQKYSYEFIIINDGSSDKTGQKIIKLQKIIDNILFINNKINQGKGAAIREGLLSAQGKYRLFLDADNATSINNLDKVWSHFKIGADIVIASRNHYDAPGAKIAVPQPVWKTFLGKAGNLIFQFLAVRGIRDTQCGFKIFTDNFVKCIIPKTKIKRWAIDAEILALAKKHKHKLKTIPVEWKNSKQKSSVGVKGYFISFKEALQIRWNFIKGKYN